MTAVGSLFGVQAVSPPSIVGVVFHGCAEAVAGLPETVPGATVNRLCASGLEAVATASTIGWRFVNPRMDQRYGSDAMPKTAENVAFECGISRTDQDAFALRSPRSR